MPLPVLIMRPEPGATATLHAATAMGLSAYAFPLFSIRSLLWKPVERADVDALLLGSANALRHAGADLNAYRGMPAYTVGETTAKAAKGAGLNVIATGKGGLQTVLDTALQPQHQRLLRLAGREHVDLSTPHNSKIIIREVYASEPVPFTAELTAMLAQPALVLLHSGEAAAHFAHECDELKIARNSIQLAVIGPRIVVRAGTGWGSVLYPDTPDDKALLALASRMCQNAG